MKRRMLLASTTAILFSGCTAGQDQLQIRYELRIDSIDDVPDEVIEHPNPEEFAWVVIEFEIDSGLVDISDLIGLTQVDTGDSVEVGRAAIVDNTVITSDEDSRTVEEGETGELFYRVPNDTEDAEWVVEQLDNQHGVEIAEQ